MKRIQSVLQQIAILSSLLLPACLVAPPPAPAPTPPSSPARIWLRPIANDSTAIEGLHLLPDGRLHLVGIYSMDGLTWSARADSLTLATATERYPAADPRSYRIEKLDADSLVLAGSSYLGGRYRRGHSLANTPLPRSRAAALYANRAIYRTFSSHLQQDDATIRFTAYLADENLRLIEERVDRGEYGSAVRYYYFEEDRLFYYRAEKNVVAANPDRASEVDSSLVLLSFTADGAVERAFKVQNNRVQQLAPHEKTEPTEHLRLLRARIAAHLGNGHFMRGYLRMGHEVRAFTPCNSEVEYWVDDLTGANLYKVYRSLVLAPPADYAQLYVELDAFAAAPSTEGFAADYDSLLTAIELRFAARETRGCADDLDGVSFRAQGNEPFWHLERRAEGIRVQQMGYAALDLPVDIDRHRLEQTVENVQVYRAEIDSTHALYLRLERQPCRDSMADSYYHFTAELELDGRSLRGCARQGTLPSK